MTYTLRFERHVQTVFGRVYTPLTRAHYRAFVTGAMQSQCREGQQNCFERALEGEQ